MITNTDFYKIIARDKGVYSVFNGIRDGLFRQLAVMNRMPIRYQELDNMIAEMGQLQQSQIDFIHEMIKEGDRFRHYECLSDGLRIHYFVNTTDNAEKESPIAIHMQEHFDAPVNKTTSTSVIVLFENHPRMIPIRYPKIIKHELTHAAVEHVIKNEPELEQFYFSDENANFVEFVCDVLPYLANPSKKENGLTKFIEDSIACFGYDAEESPASEFLEQVSTAISEAFIPNDGFNKDKEDSGERFSSVRDKYIFALTETDGKTRTRLLGVTERLYEDKDAAHDWMIEIYETLRDGNIDDPDTKKAIKKLEQLYTNMIDVDS